MTDIMTDWLKQLEQALSFQDLEKTLQLFNEDSYWRDLLAFTWNIKTLEGKDEIEAMLAAVLSDVQPSKWIFTGEATKENGAICGAFTFETVNAMGEGYLRLVEGKCWTLMTSMTALKGHEEKKSETRVKGVPHGIEPYCVVVGGGQCGIALGARLKQLNIPTIILDKNKRPGDAWRNRYHALCLHDPVYMNHFPYIPFPDHWPVFSPKDKIGDWLEAYTKIMDLVYWSSSECIKAAYDEGKQRWNVSVLREGKHMILHPQQLVLATGLSGFPFTPEFTGAKDFKGEQCHSSQFTTGQVHAKKKCIVLGSNNSAHDICADLYEHGADVTMIQPSSSTVIRQETLMEMGFKLYSEAALKAGISTHKADLIGASIPYKVKAIQDQSFCKKIRQKDADFYARLTKAGFQLDFGEDESGASMKYLRRGSGYYFDVGASELISEGKIKLKSGLSFSRIKENSIVLTDGSEMAADLIVYATGYSNMSTWISHLISEEVANLVGPCWGLGSDTKKDPGPWEGELRNMWKPTQQTGLWLHGGNLKQSRYYSQMVALQIKARMEGLQTPVYLPDPYPQV